jgi:hypothetical protein
MRRFLPLIAVGALLLGGCAFTDQQQPQRLEDPLLTHALVKCQDYTRVANTQQTAEPKARLLHHTCCGAGCTPPLPSSFVCLDFGTTLTNKEAKDYSRFVGPWSEYGNRLAVYNCASYMDPGCGTWALSSQKLNPDGTVQFNTYWRPLGRDPDTNAQTWDGQWDCAFQSSNMGGKPAGFAAGEAQMAGNGAEMAARTTNPAYQRSWGDWQIQTVAIDRAPGLQWGANVVAAEPGQIAYGYSTFTGWNYPYNMGSVTQAPIKPTAGLADFFAGEPLTVGYHGYDITGTADLADDGSLSISILRVEHEGSVFVPSTPIMFEGSRDNLHAWALNREANQDSMIEFGEWALENVPMDQGVSLGGFIPELGITLPDIEVYFVSESIRNYLARASSQIQPRDRGRLR